MYQKRNREQMTFDEFILPFGGKLSAENRWIKIKARMPWDLIETLYAKNFRQERRDGRPPLSSRIAFGAIYIKEQENLTDDQTVAAISENPYMQCFLGLSGFQNEPLFDASMMTHFRKRFCAKDMAAINEKLYHRMNQADDQEPPSDQGTSDSDSDSGDGVREEEKANKGTLILDATAAPADIRYPTDLSLLNECRENTEAMIEQLWEGSCRRGHKTAYRRDKARAGYLAIQKQKRPRKAKVKQEIRNQLDYVKKNLQTLKRLMGESETRLCERQQKRLEIIETVLKQQEEMHQEKKHTIANRIVSLRQPHIRPIVRGKAGTPVEFGQKLAFAVVDGYTFIEKQSWDSFAEGTTLKESVSRYHQRHGCYPEAILADTAYRSRDNLDFCKQRGIRLSGPALGRPKKSEREANKAQIYQDSCDRNVVEGRNGIAKRRYGLDLILSTLACTAETEVALNVLAMNVAHVLRVLLRFFPGRWLVCNWALILGG